MELYKKKKKTRLMSIVKDIIINGQSLTNIIERNGDEYIYFKLNS